MTLGRVLGKNAPQPQSAAHQTRSPGKRLHPKALGTPSPRTSNMLQFETYFSKSRHFPQECILHMKHHETTTQTRRGWTLISSHSSVASYGMGRSLAGIVPEVINNTNPPTNYHH